MNKDFIDVSNAASVLAKQIKLLVDSLPGDGSADLENREMYTELCNVLFVLESYKETCDYFKRDFKDGYLKQISNGKFATDCNDREYCFNCGDALEIFISDEEEDYSEWHYGTVDYSTERGGYYLKCTDVGNPWLDIGMHVRIR